MKKLFVILFSAATVSVGMGQQSKDGQAEAAGHQDKSFKLLGSNMYEVTQYFESGKVKEIGYYQNGKKHGTWTSFNEEGVQLAEANYLKGKKDGKWTVWVADESSRYEIIYSRGQKMATYKFDNDNRLLANK